MVETTWSLTGRDRRPMKFKKSLNLGSDKFRESRNRDSRTTNGLQIRIPGDVNPRTKYL